MIGNDGLTDSEREELAAKRRRVVDHAMFQTFGIRPPDQEERDAIRRALSRDPEGEK